MKKIRKTVSQNKELFAWLAIITVAAAVVAILFACGTAQRFLAADSPEPKGPHLTVCFADVGQGDCTVLTCDGHSMMVDGGAYAGFRGVETALRECGVKSLDYLLMTHAHSDHIGSLHRVIQEYPVGKFLSSPLSVPQTGKSDAYIRLQKTVAERQIPCGDLDAGDTLDLGDARITVLGPTALCEDLNDCSLVLRVDYGTTSFLLAGDAEEAEDRLLQESGADLDCDVLKVGHHGDSAASSEAFLNAVTPVWAVISCGIDNEYNHPDLETVEYLTSCGAAVYRTDWNGWVKMYSDGVQITAEIEKNFA